MKRILILTACALALLLVLTGCNIAPSPAETTEEVTQEELTSEEVTTEAVTTEKKEVNTALGNVPPGDITVIRGKNKDEFLQNYEDSEISKNGRYPIKSDVITEALTFEALQGVLEPFAFAYREFPEIGFEFEFQLYAPEAPESFPWMRIRIDYWPDGYDVSQSSTLTPLDESNGIYQAPFGEVVAYCCILNDQTRLDFSLAPDHERYEELQELLFRYALGIKTSLNEEATAQ